MSATTGAVGTSPSGMPVLASSPLTGFPLPPPPPGYLALGEVSPPHRGLRSPLFVPSASYHPTLRSPTGKQAGAHDFRGSGWPSSVPLNPLAPAFEPQQCFQQQMQLLQRLRAASTASGATTCSVKSTDGGPSLLSSPLLPDNRAPVGRAVSSVFPPQQHPGSPFLRWSSTGPSVAHSRPVASHPRLARPGTGGLSAEVADVFFPGGMLPRGAPTPVARESPVPFGPGPGSGGAGSCWLGGNRSGAQTSARGLDEGLAEVLDPAEANKMLLQLGRQLRLTHLQIQVVVRKAGSAGLRLNDLPAAFLKEHNAVLDIRSLGLLQIREVIAGMGRSLVLQTQEEPPLTGREASPVAPRTEGDACTGATSALPSSSSALPCSNAVAAPESAESGAAESKSIEGGGPTQGTSSSGETRESNGAAHSKTTKAIYSSSSPSSNALAWDDESRLTLKLGKPLPPVMKELLQHLLVSLVADALHHLSPAPFVAARPASFNSHRGLGNPSESSAQTLSPATTIGPAGSSPRLFPASQSPAILSPSPRDCSHSGSPAVPACRSHSETTQAITGGGKEEEPHRGPKAAAVGAPECEVGAGAGIVAGSPLLSGATSRGIPLQLLPTLWQLKYGLRCSLSAMLETCGYTSLKAFILEELPCLRICPLSSQVILCLTPTPPAPLNRKDPINVTPVPSAGKKGDPSGHNTPVPPSGHELPAQPNSTEAKGANCHEGLGPPNLDAHQQGATTSPLSSVKANRSTLDAVAAAAAAVQASGVSLPTLLVALSSSFRPAARGFAAGALAEAEGDCGARPMTSLLTQHMLRRFTRQDAPSEPTEERENATASAASGLGRKRFQDTQLFSHQGIQTDERYQQLRSDERRRTPQVPAGQHHRYSDSLVEALAKTAGESAVKSVLSRLHPPPGPHRSSALMPLPVVSGAKGKPMGSHADTSHSASLEFSSDKSVGMLPAPCANSSQLPMAFATATSGARGLVSRLHLHRMLYEVIAMACEKKGRRWARGEDLIELEEEMQQSEASAWKGRGPRPAGLGEARACPLASLSDVQTSGAEKGNPAKAASFSAFTFSASAGAPSRECEAAESGRRSMPPSLSAEFCDDRDGDDEEDSSSSGEEDLEDRAGSTNGFVGASLASAGGDAKDVGKTEGDENVEDATHGGPDGAMTDARLLRRRLKKREKKEKKRRKKEKLKALDEHELKQKRLLSLVDLLQLPPSPSATSPVPPLAPLAPSPAGRGDSLVTPTSRVSLPQTPSHSKQTDSAPSSPCPLSRRDADSPSPPEDPKQGPPTSPPPCASSAAVAAAPTPPPGETESVSAAVLADSNPADPVDSASKAAESLLPPPESPPPCPISQILLSLSDEEVAAELQQFHNRSVGVLVSAIKGEWERRFGPHTPSLQAYMEHFRVRQLKSLLLEVPNLLILGAGGNMRVSTLEHAMNFCNPFPPPTTVFLSHTGRKVTLPLTLTAPSPLPCFRAHSYTHEASSNCALTLHRDEAARAKVNDRARSLRGPKRESGGEPEEPKGRWNTGLDPSDLTGSGAPRDGEETEGERGAGRTLSGAARGARSDRGATEMSMDNAWRVQGGRGEAQSVEHGEARRDEGATGDGGKNSTQNVDFAYKQTTGGSAIGNGYSKAPLQLSPRSRNVMTTDIDVAPSVALPSLLSFGASHQIPASEAADAAFCRSALRPALGPRSEGQPLVAPPTVHATSTRFSKHDGHHRVRAETAETLWKAALMRRHAGDGTSGFPLGPAKLQPGYRKSSPGLVSLSRSATESIQGPGTAHNSCRDPMPSSSLAPTPQSHTGSSAHSMYCLSGTPGLCSAGPADPRRGPAFAYMLSKNGESPAAPPSGLGGPVGGPSLSSLASASKGFSPETMAGMERLLARFLLLDPTATTAAAAVAAALAASPPTQGLSRVAAAARPPAGPGNAVSALSCLLTPAVKTGHWLKRGPEGSQKEKILSLGSESGVGDGEDWCRGGFPHALDSRKPAMPSSVASSFARHQALPGCQSLTRGSLSSFVYPSLQRLSKATRDYAPLEGPGPEEGAGVQLPRPASLPPPSQLPPGLAGPSVAAPGAAAPPAYRSSEAVARAPEGHDKSAGHRLSGRDGPRMHSGALPRAHAPAPLGGTRLVPGKQSPRLRRRRHDQIAASLSASRSSYEVLAESAHAAAAGGAFPPPGDKRSEVLAMDQGPEGTATAGGSEAKRRPRAIEGLREARRAGKKAAKTLQTKHSVPPQSPTAPHPAARFAKPALRRRGGVFEPETRAPSDRQGPPGLSGSEPLHGRGKGDPDGREAGDDSKRKRESSACFLGHGNEGDAGLPKALDAHNREKGDVAANGGQAAAASIAPLPWSDARSPSVQAPTNKKRYTPRSLRPLRKHKKLSRTFQPLDASSPSCSPSRPWASSSSDKRLDDASTCTSRAQPACEPASCEAAERQGRTAETAICNGSREVPAPTDVHVRGVGSSLESQVGNEDGDDGKNATTTEHTLAERTVGGADAGREAPPGSGRKEPSGDEHARPRLGEETPDDVERRTMRGADETRPGGLGGHRAGLRTHKLKVNLPWTRLHPRRKTDRPSPRSGRRRAHDGKTEATETDADAVGNKAPVLGLPPASPLSPAKTRRSPEPNTSSFLASSSTFRALSSSCSPLCERSPGAAAQFVAGDARAQTMTPAGKDEWTGRLNRENRPGLSALNKLRREPRGRISPRGPGDRERGQEETKSAGLTRPASHAGGPPKDGRLLAAQAQGKGKSRRKHRSVEHPGAVDYTAASKKASPAQRATESNTGTPQWKPKASGS
ncbi:hypothetical protein BESB_000090 [Besnoitia besnoiti]|uniref:HTH OST-type domain-containing protein n=1 Tax=Besnoitia besnoiti TaxID=94643 RepID=A0A2A9MNY2_BESBE|nr:hypothetical protein BESB_000090 [Besnoitia besnoiti]PFH37667.1 hypothetical protein BESB_000090 [Besnoitia besnoiti]